MDAETRLKIEERIIAMLKTVYDPEIPVNIYDLGLIYKIDLQDDGDVSIDMTLTAPNCPAADFIMEDVRQKVDSVEGVNSSVINLVFEPEWDKDMMSEEAKLELGFLKDYEEYIFPFGCTFGVACNSARTDTGTPVGELFGQNQA